MTHEQIIPAVTNIHTKKVFVLVDNSTPNKMTIINPEGKLLTVPEGLFDKPFFVTEAEFAQHFTHEQTSAINKYFKRSGPKAVASAGTGNQNLLVPKKRPATGKRREVVKVSARSNPLMLSEWSATKLTFYKHKIDPMGEEQSFRITLEDGQTFKMKKSDFVREFNDVVISTQYWKEGAFSYSQVPDKAKKYKE